MNGIRELPDEDIVQRRLHLSEYTDEIQREILAEVENRPGLKAKVRTAMSDDERCKERIRTDNIAEERSRKQRFPGFVLGVFGGTIPIIILGIFSDASIGEFAFSVFVIEALAVTFLSLHDATMSAKHWGRFSVFLGGTIIASGFLCYVVGWRQFSLGGAFTGLIFILYFSGVGWLGSKILTRVVSVESPLYDILTRYWPDLKE